MRVSFSTHNLNGFTRNKEFLRSRCRNESDTIQCLQEHWLKPPFKRVKGVNELQHLHDDFEGFGGSAMKDSIGKNIQKGRPYGGTGFLWNKKFAKCIQPRIDLKHERVTVLELKDERFNILCVNGYLPYLDKSNITRPFFRACPGARCSLFCSRAHKICWQRARFALSILAGYFLLMRIC